MSAHRSKTVPSGAAEREPVAPDIADGAEPSVWHMLSDEDRASLLSALARSRAGIFASDEDVEAAFALFGP